MNVHGNVHGRWQGPGARLAGRDSRHITLQLALAQLNGLYVTDYSVVMAGTLVAIVPLIIVFLFGARHFIRNIAAGALKG
ncbi:hypothetical protein [Streptomyces niveus]|uniref:hypothetical protein n=1 Tax=Streptomyces niveus TaxID=193462 RepID=UPI0003C5E72A|nr:hypothetical protein [Streptomyces niveus]EST19432.1 hypothetical protein M877_36445 [Streptomyces niveus NCIMB 11891]